MHTTDLTPTDTQAIHQIASILVAAFREHWPDAWPDTDFALGEIQRYENRPTSTPRLEKL